jgi:hypothetical protein
MIILCNVLFTPSTPPAPKPQSENTAPRSSTRLRYGSMAGSRGELMWLRLSVWVHLPIPTPRAPKQRALTTSVPLLIPPSTHTSILSKRIILSNHGGRSLDTAPPAVHTMLEIRKYCPEVFDIVWQYTHLRVFGFP